MTNYSRNELQVLRAMCDEDLIFFTRLFYKELRGSKFITNWHHYEIAKYLEKVETYELEFLNIAIPPRCSKTELAISHVARSLGINPSANFLYITASDELRSEVSTRIRDIITNPLFKLLYNVEIKKDQSAKNLWRTKSGGGLKTATIFGQITGFGAGQMIDNSLIEDIRTFEGSIVLDDINKIEDTENNNANNQKATRVIFNTIFSRKNSSDTPIINIQQRAGVTDATSEFEKHYKDNEKAYFLVLPIVQKDGTLLWQWKYPKEKVEELKNSPKTKHVFQTQYMQNPKPREGLMYDIRKFYNESEIDFSNALHFTFTDPANGGDYTCVWVIALLDRKLYVRDCVYRRCNTKLSKELLLQVAQKYKSNVNIIETNKYGTELVNYLKRSSVQAKGVNVPSSISKQSRIIHNAEYVNMLYFRNNQPDEYKEAFEVLESLPANAKTTNDDSPDALTLGVDYFKNKFKHIFIVSDA